MTTKNVLQPLDVNSRNVDRSPVRKRARYESPIKERWSLARSDVLLDEVYDYGVSLLADSDSEAASEDEKESCYNASKEEVAILESSLSKDTLKAGEWSQFLTKKKVEREVSTTDHFEELSDEMVLHILHFLPKYSLSVVGLVCRRWHSLTQDESLWARMDVSCRQLKPGSLGHILSRQVMILRLAQSEISFPPIIEGCRAFNEDFRSRLLFLDLSMAHISCDGLIQLFRKCRRLKKISLEHVAINTNVLETLAVSEDLEVINLTMAEGLNEHGLKSLLTKCKKIRELNLAWTYMNTSCIKYICSNLPRTLDRLNMAGCRKLLNDENVRELVNCCGGLRELDLSDCTGLTGDAVKHVTLLEGLNFLALSRCYQIPYKALMYLKRMTSLMYLDVHGGYIETGELRLIQEALGPLVHLNKFKFSSIARPTVGTRRSSIWNMRVRD